MSIEVTDYINVKKRSEELGCRFPTGLTLLPANFETALSKDDLIDEEFVTTIRSLWRQAGLTETRIEDKNYPAELKRSFDIVLPTIFVGVSILTQNPTLVSIAINIISNYLTDFFKGIPGIHKVKLDIVVETTEGEYRQLKYEGSEKGLGDLPAIIEEMRK